MSHFAFLLLKWFLCVNVSFLKSRGVAKNATVMELRFSLFLPKKNNKCLRAMLKIEVTIKDGRFWLLKPFLLEAGFAL